MFVDAVDEIFLFITQLLEQNIIYICCRKCRWDYIIHGNSFTINPINNFIVICQCLITIILKINKKTKIEFFLPKNPYEGRNFH